MLLSMRHWYPGGVGGGERREAGDKGRNVGVGVRGEPILSAVLNGPSLDGCARVQRPSLWATGTPRHRAGKHGMVRVVPFSTVIMPREGVRSLR